MKFFFLFVILCGSIAIASDIVLILMRVWWSFLDWDRDRDIVKAYPELKGQLR